MQREARGGEARDREGCGRAFLSAFLSPTPLLVTTFHLSLASLWPSPSETASTQQKKALNRERRERKKENGERKEHKLFIKGLRLRSCSTLLSPPLV